MGLLKIVHWKKSKMEMLKIAVVFAYILVCYGKEDLPNVWIYSEGNDKVSEYMEEQKAAFLTQEKALKNLLIKQFGKLSSKEEEIVEKILNYKLYSNLAIKVEDDTVLAVATIRKLLDYINNNENRASPKVKLVLLNKAKVDIQNIWKNMAAIVPKILDHTKDFDNRIADETQDKMDYLSEKVQEILETIETTKIE